MKIACRIALELALVIIGTGGLIMFLTAVAP